MAGTDTDVVILGVCASGKSTLAKRLTRDGMRVRTIAQEHSIIPDLWKGARAAATIYLHASFEAVKSRRATLMHERNYLAQLDRLRHARAAATFEVDTSRLSAEQVYKVVHARLTQDGSVETPVPPIADEPGSDIQPVPAHPAPVPDEPGEASSGREYKGLPIPEEL